MSTSYRSSSRALLILWQSIVVDSRLFIYFFSRTLARFCCFLVKCLVLSECEFAIRRIIKKINIGNSGVAKATNTREKKCLIHQTINHSY